jgi:hypothetical protein
MLTGLVSFSAKAQSSNSNVLQAVNTACCNQYAHVQHVWLLGHFYLLQG